MCRIRPATDIKLSRAGSRRGGDSAAFTKRNNYDDNIYFVVETTETL